MLFALTIECYIRNDFKSDCENIHECLNILRDVFKCEMGDIAGWELQPNGMNNLHVHTYFASDSRLNFKDLYERFSRYNCKAHIQELKSSFDFRTWRKYCEKRYYDLAHAYAESSRSDKTNMFLHNVTAQQKRHSGCLLTRICQFCDQPKGNLCGLYKCWVTDGTNR